MREGFGSMIGLVGMRGRSEGERWWLLERGGREGGREGGYGFVDTMVIGKSSAATANTAE